MTPPSKKERRCLCDSSTFFDNKGIHCPFEKAVNGIDDAKGATEFWKNEVFEPLRRDKYCTKPGSVKKSFVAYYLEVFWPVQWKYDKIIAEGVRAVPVAPWAPTETLAALSATTEAPAVLSAPTEAPAALSTPTETPEALPAPIETPAASSVPTASSVSSISAVKASSSRPAGVSSVATSPATPVPISRFSLLPLAPVSASDPSAPAPAADEEKVELSPEYHCGLAHIETLPKVESAKFSNSSAQVVYVNACSLLKRFCVIPNDGGERTIEYQRFMPVLTPLPHVKPQDVRKKPSINLSSCPCASVAVSGGERLVRSENAVRDWNNVVQDVPINSPCPVCAAGQYKSGSPNVSGSTVVSYTNARVPNPADVKVPEVPARELPGQQQISPATVPSVAATEFEADGEFCE